MNVTDRIENDLRRAWGIEWRLKSRIRLLETTLYQISLASDPTAQHVQPANELMSAIHKFSRKALDEGEE
jgi:hypothetical protein